MRALATRSPVARGGAVHSHRVAEESLRTGKIVIASDPRRQKRIAAAVKAYHDSVIAGTERLGDQPDYMLTYGVDGVEFTVVVYQRKRWFVDGDADGLSVMAHGADGKSRTEHFTARFDDLPAAVRAVAIDVRAGLTGGETAAKKTRARRRKAADDQWTREQMRRHPTWYANGVFDREAMNAELAEAKAMFARARETRLATAREIREDAAKARAGGYERRARELDERAQEIEDAEREDAA